MVPVWVLEREQVLWVIPSLIGRSGLSAVVEKLTGGRMGCGGGLPDSKLPLLLISCVIFCASVSSFIIIDNNNR